jgi:cation:H+ antiporter
MLATFAGTEVLALHLAGRLRESLWDQSVWVLWGLVPVSIALLVVGADRTVSAAVRLARTLGMSTVIVGATVVSLGTTLPEMFTSVTAAFSGEGGLALGNGVGSIICNTGLVFGLCCLLAPLPLNRFILNRHGWLKLGSGVLLVVICVAVAVAGGGIGKLGTANEDTWNHIPRWVGWGLVALLAGYMYLSVRWARAHPEIVAEAVADAGGPTAARTGVTAAVLSLLVLAAGVLLVAAGSNVLIPTVSVLAEKHYHVPKDILAVTLVAFGTSLPELVTAIAAILKGHRDLLVGNIVGADILNVLFVVGLSSTAAELEVPPTFYMLHLPVMLALLVLLRIYIFMSGNTFRRWQGVPLVLIYIGYVIALIRFAPQLAGH